MGAVNEGAAIVRSTSDNISAIEALRDRLNERKKLKFMVITAKGPGQLVTLDDLFEAVEALSAYPALLAEARKAEAMKREIAELREALRPFAAVEPVSISTSDGHISSNAFRRARTLLNGGSDAQPF